MSTCDNRNISNIRPPNIGYNASIQLLVIIGIFANLSVVIVFMKCKIHRRSFTYLLVFQQSFLDLIACGLFLCFYNIFAPNGNFANYCKLATLFFFFLSASSLNLVFISLERYIAVVYPFKYWIRGNQTQSNLPQLCIPLIAAFLITVQYVFILEEDPSEPGKCSACYKNEGFQILSGIILLLANAVIPICTMIFCYSRVYIALNKQTKIRAELTTQVHINRANDESAVEINVLPSQTQQNDKANENQRNFIITMSINTLVYTICVSPLVLLYLVYTICECFNINDHISEEIVVFIALSNIVVNPFVYAYKLNDYKEGFSKTFCCHFKRSY